MDVHEILEQWPSFAGLGTEAFMALPYWRMPVWYADKEAALTRREPFGEDGDILTLAVTLDGADHVLTLADSGAFSDLHLLWARRTGLPQEVLIALCERELGDFFRMLEKTLRCELSVKGLTEPERPMQATQAFRLTAPAGEIDFAMDLTSAQIQVFGRRDYVNLANGELRALMRPARAEYGTVLLTEAERAALKQGDFVLTPEGDGTSRWMLELPKDPAVHVMGAAEIGLTLGQLLDDDLPAVPETDDVILVVDGKVIASATRTHLGEAAALKIVKV